MKYATIPAFDKDFKKLSKRYRTLESDFTLLKKAHIEALHIHGIKSDDPVEIVGTCGETYKSYKVRKFACKSLPGRGKQSGLRVIYVYEPATDKITFVEIYFKADQENEDKIRLKEFIAEIKV